MSVYDPETTEDRGNNWLLSPLPEPETGRYYLECAWCHDCAIGINWKCTSPAMFVDVNDPLEYPYPPYLCDHCRSINGTAPITLRESYAEYLQGEHWQGVRQLALERAGRKCQLCSSREFLQVHHNNYLRLGCEWPQDVFVLCDSCHGLHHGKDARRG